MGEQNNEMLSFGLKSNPCENKIYAGVNGFDVNEAVSTPKLFLTYENPFAN